MENLERLIRGYNQTSDDSTKKLIDAVVLSVSSEFVSATVRLITGQEIENLSNKSGEKIFIGQSVKVGYHIKPEAGWIDKVNGEPNPVRIASYDTENTPTYDTDNNQTTSTEEIILNVCANTKLIHGTRKILSLQGYACRFGDYNTIISVDNASNFGTHLEFDSLWRNSAEDDFIECHHTVDLYILQRSYSSSSGKISFTPAVKCNQYNKSTGELLYSGCMGTWSVSDPLDIFIVPTVNAISSLPEFNGQSTPYGYVMANKLWFYVGYIQNSDPSVIKYVERYISGGYSAHIYLHGENSLSCIPIESLDEQYFNFAVTKRIEPITLGGG